MPVPLPRIRAVTLVLAFVARAPAVRLERDGVVGGGALYTQTNDPTGNTVQRVRPCGRRLAHPAGTFATGGVGLAGLGGRQGAVELSGDGRYLYAVNAGSDSVSVFRIDRRRHPADRHRRLARRRAGEHRRAPRPRLRAQLRRHAERDRVLAPVRRLAEADPRRHPRRSPPAPQGAAQVSVTPDGRSLVVSERVSNRLETLPLDLLGRPGAPVVTASSGAVPFGFGITQQGTIVVSEAGASTVSSYRARRARRAAHRDRVAARRPGRRVLGRRLAERPLRLHRQRGRRHQRLRDRRVTGR